MTRDVFLKKGASVRAKIFLRGRMMPSATCHLPPAQRKAGKSGFTLIELMVATTIFTIVSVVAIGAILTINSANRKAQAIRAVVDNLNFTMETMSRKLRVGSKFHCGTLVGGVEVGDLDIPNPGDCGGDGKNEMSYLSSGVTASGDNPDLPAGVSVDPRVVTYKLVRNSGSYGKIVGLQDPDGDSNIDTLIMTPPEIDIEDLRFFVRRGGANNRPTVTITVSGIITLAQDKLTTPFNLQTTVTSRLLTTESP